MSINVTTALVKPLSLVLLSLFTGTALVGDLIGVTMSDERLDSLAKELCEKRSVSAPLRWDSLTSDQKDTWRRMAAQRLNDQEAV
ncbi:hypothetical protein DDK00_00320 [Mycobacteroides abscessus]|uniref:Uncharacterized protein n=2 Tax=Mycobacteroides abscessus TaxID=36809 RepID=B1MND3_MYCA9|nr:hypothetical protein [Mycobacteroides abscessus]EPZ17511.1 hypothetical protein M879_26190 [Mycobacteroides abscessus V06705]MBN7295353.1 hypothetical protein [Mycobacteroides abscessus subsp. abscessus]QPO17527.1 hypothetical protein PHIGD23-1_70 [Mycobacterium phage phiGD23-1]QPO17647.1 hypothetical protein PHIGD22-1_70 [Mycobacterium phage phiGD22-1]QPO17829.1 hypothetical protein PROPHIGD20-1_68 [Mycobacterium phage phiGD20-1]QSM01707.1 hypothetical protein PROPHIGD11-1_37 [Mycobacteri